MLPAIAGSARGRLVAIASRDQPRAEALAARHQVPNVHADYDGVLGDPGVDAVYIPLVNNLHREWTERALAAGKHVLCEKPLSTSAADAEAMAEASRHHDRLLMEAFMYRFDRRTIAFVSSQGGARFVHAAFGFTVADPSNYRLRPELGGGALLDVGCYCLDAVRWLLGDPGSVAAVASGNGVDMTLSAALAYPGGAQATVWASFQAPEHQELVVIAEAGVKRLARPFTSGLQPYVAMVDAFNSSLLEGLAAPRSLEESIATMRLIERVRSAAGLDYRPN